MKHLLFLAALAALAMPAQAKIVATADLPDGGQIVLHDIAGPCQGEALLVELIAANGDRFPGCWRDRGELVSIVFLDGDLGRVPKGALKPPKDI